MGTIKYDQETTQKLIDAYNSGMSPEEIAEKFEVPVRSAIAKLSSLGIYRKREYTDKQGNPPVKKEEYDERIAKLLGARLDQLESLETANNSVLKLLESALKEE